MTSLPLRPGAERTAFRRRFGHNIRILNVIAGTEFKLKYLDSLLGYVWSVAKPLGYFAVIWLLLGHIFKVGIPINNYPLYLLLGIAIYQFFTETTSATMSSIALRGGLLRRIAFPRIVVPLAVAAATSITFFINSSVVAAFIAGSRVAPRLSWLWLLPLLLELYLVTIGLGLIMATLFVRFRDVGQIWELVSQWLFFAMPVMYSISFMPPRAQKVILVNPVAQVMQDVRAAILGPKLAGETTAAVLGGAAWRLLPIGIAVGVFAFGLWLFQREAPRFAERV